MRSRARHIALLLAGLLAGSLLFELYLRLAEATPLGRVLPVAEVSLYGPSQETGYAQRPGVRGLWITENRAAVAINALGLRDQPDRRMTKPAGTLRLAIAGDSMVEALQVPLADTFPALTETALRRQGRAVEVLNLGLAGATPAVLVARLMHEVPRLGIDGAIVILNLGEVARAAPDDDSAFVGYVPGPGDRAVLGYGFRDGRGYRLRTGAAGQAIYGAIDHVRLALVINNRRNAGVLADLAPAPIPAVHVAGAGPCDDATFRNVAGVLAGASTGFGPARLEAIVADLAGVSRATGARIVVALRGLASRCPNDGEASRAAATAATKRLAAAGLASFDLDRAIERHRGARPLRELSGFGARIGAGHLNEAGHRVYAAAMLEAIAQAGLDRR